MYLDESLNFSNHIREKMFKAMKRIGLIRRLNKAPSQHSLITMYKSFVGPHLGYGDIIYDQPNKENFNHKIERIQCNTTLAIAGAIKGTYQSRLCNELDPESLKSRRWFRKLCTFL